MQEYVWKIMHNPTGLFFSPSGYQQGKKSNLSEKGKIYANKPSLAYVKYAEDKDRNRLNIEDFSIRMYELSLVSISKNVCKKKTHILTKCKESITNIPKPEFPHDLS